MHVQFAYASISLATDGEASIGEVASNAAWPVGGAVDLDPRKWRRCVPRVAGVVPDNEVPVLARAWRAAGSRPLAARRPRVPAALPFRISCDRRGAGLGGMAESRGVTACGQHTRERAAIVSTGWQGGARGNGAAAVCAATMAVAWRKTQSFATQHGRIELGQLSEFCSCMPVRQAAPVASGAACAAPDAVKRADSIGTPGWPNARAGTRGDPVRASIRAFDDKGGPQGGAVALYSIGNGVRAVSVFEKV